LEDTINKESLVDGCDNTLINPYIDTASGASVLTFHLDAHTWVVAWSSQGSTGWWE